METKPNILDYFDYTGKGRDLAYIAADTSKPYLERIKSFSDFWKLHEKDIIEFNTEQPHSPYLNYVFEYSTLFTPIEEWAWMAMRSISTIPFYPQYPVLSFIADFANPHRKIIVELDGKEFHNERKDAWRDSLIERDGWGVFRISGSDMYKEPEYGYLELDRMYGYREISFYQYIDLFQEYLNTGEGFFRALRLVYKNEIDVNDEEGFEKYKCCVRAIMSRNKSGNFEIPESKFLI